MGKFFNVFLAANDIALFVCEAAILCGCYLTGLFLDERTFEGPIFVESFLRYNGLLRIAFVVATIILGLSFNRLYDSCRVGPRAQVIKGVCLAVGLAFLTQAFVGYLLSGWILPRYTMILGSLIVLIVVPLFRIVYASVVFRGKPVRSLRS
jgi:hypothetical protein